MISVQRLQRGKMMSTESTGHLGHRIWVSRADFSLLRNPQNLQLWPTTNSSDWRWWKSWQLHKMTLWYENLKLMQQRSMYFGASCGPQVETSYPCPTMLCMPQRNNFYPRPVWHCRVEHICIHRQPPQRSRTSLRFSQVASCWKLPSGYLT
jgi:hypothetical protein